MNIRLDTLSSSRSPDEEKTVQDPELNTRHTLP